MTTMSDASQYRALCGWRGIDATQRVCASAFGALDQIASHLFGGVAPTEPVLLYKAWQDVARQVSRLSCRNRSAIA